MSGILEKEWTETSVDSGFQTEELLNTIRIGHNKIGNTWG